MEWVGEVMSEPEAHRTASLAARAATYTTRVAHLRSLRDQATAELCSHGVALGNCLDCRATDPDTTHLRETEDS